MNVNFSRSCLIFLPLPSCPNSGYRDEHIQPEACYSLGHGKEWMALISTIITSINQRVN
ncbi:MAG: hypothetical protein WCP85_02140 [Mariniphaga sp.]